MDIMEADESGITVRRLTEGDLQQIPQEIWSIIPHELHSDSLYAQDTVNLLAKLRTRLIIPSNVLSMGSLIVCKGHLLQVLKSLLKEKHGLTYRTIDCKDKQNFSRIELLAEPFLTL